MGIGDAGILAVGQSVEGVAKEMLTSLVDEDTELISLYYGQDVLEADAVRFAQETRNCIRMQTWMHILEDSRYITMYYP